MADIIMFSISPSGQYRQSDHCIVYRSNVFSAFNADDHFDSRLNRHIYDIEEEQETFADPKWSAI
jgi:hypothetical protein